MSASATWGPARAPRGGWPASRKPPWPGRLAPPLRAAGPARLAARLAPRFDSVRFGDPGYARLAHGAAPELTRGAHDEGELGAYHDLWQPLRIADLESQLRQFVPAGTGIGIRFAT